MNYFIISVPESIENDNMKKNKLPGSISMLKRIILSSYLLVFLLSFIITDYANAQQIYYPLAVGNIWEYQGLGPWGQISITKDIIMPNGKMYAEFVGTWHKFLRQEENRVYEYYNSLQKEHLLFDFSKSPGDTIITIPHDEDTTDIIMLSRDTIEFFGKYRLHYSFLIDARQIIDDEEVIEIVDSIGNSAITVAFGHQVLYRALIDGGLYETTNVEDDQESLFFSLSQNYPNPFNPKTTISFSIDKEDLVELKIYDILGREVSTLINANLSAGKYEILWDGSSYSSGVYYYSIRAGEKISTRKMLLLK